MLIRVNETQQAALTTIAADPLARGVHMDTLDALVRKDLVRDVSVGYRVRYELTGTGRLLLGEVTPAPADGPQQPADPFATIPQDELERF
jgi:hypothetical protein